MHSINAMTKDTLHSTSSRIVECYTLGAAGAGAGGAAAFLTGAGTTILGAAGAAAAACCCCCCGLAPLLLLLLVLVLDGDASLAVALAGALDAAAGVDGLLGAAAALVTASTSNGSAALTFAVASLASLPAACVIR